MASEHGHAPDKSIYYVPDQSKYPLFTAMAVAAMLVGVSTWLIDLQKHQPASPAVLIGGFLVLAVVLFCWFGSTIRENLLGYNNDQLKRSYRMGMHWFIFSEVMFFLTFFGALFYMRALVGPWLSGEGVGHFTNILLWPGFTYQWPMLETPQQAVGGVANQLIANNGVFDGAKKDMGWPGFANATHWLPLWNTLFLVTSSITCEIAHHALKAGNRTRFIVLLGVTLVLGFSFVYLQAVEYHEAYTEMGLTLKAGIYGTTFFMLTGFHGFHVCMGAFILLVMFIRALKGHFNKDDHFGFEAASWYWHFVDVVWLFLVVVVYVF